MRFLCVSDIHGHAAALEAVLQEVGLDDFNKLVACGDLCFPGPEPLKVWTRLVELQALCVQGVSDRAIARLDPDKLEATSPEQQARVNRLREVHTELGQLIVARLGKLPPIARLPVESGHTLTFVHGSPVDPTECFTPDMSDEEMNALLGDNPGDIVICGGSHQPFDRQVGDVRVVSVGSVGEAPGGGWASALIVESSPFSVAFHPIDVKLGAQP